MAELRMGYASFVHYAKEKGLEFTLNGNNSLTFYYHKKKTYDISIMPGKSMNDCGSVFVNIHDFKTLFGDSYEHNRDIRASERPKDNRPDGKVDHCSLPPELWGNIETEVKPGKIINCLRE